MRTETRAVVIGGGIAGASIAYHLAELGWRDTVVLDQGELVSGTTSHAPGLVGQLRTSPSLTRMLMYSVSLYRTLQVDSVPGFLGEGSLRLASSPQRQRQLEEQARFAARVGLEAHLVSVQEVEQRCPLLNTAGVEGALHLPGDGSAVAPILAHALIAKARALGVAFHPNMRVRGIDVSNQRIDGVQTDAGTIKTETLIIAAGIWSSLIGRLAGVTLPLTPMQHQYVATEPLPELAGRIMPNLRDPDNLIYLRQREQSLILGGYERKPRPFDSEQIPRRVDPTVQTFDTAHFAPLLAAGRGRVPLLRNVKWERQVNGLEAFTPDGEFLLGPIADVQGLWTACGFCAHGVSGAGGVGKVLAEWIVNDDPGLDLFLMAPDRFRDRDLSQELIRNEACRVYGTYYDMPADSTQNA